MRHALLFAPALLLAAATAASAVSACGGSSSETPWPVEPEALQQGPSQERALPPAILIEERRDGGKPKKP